MADKKTSLSSKVRNLKSDLILNGALSVFSRKGVSEATLEDIASEAGFSKASLYNYFPNKEAIFLGVAMREADYFVDVLMNSGETSVSPERSFKENMRTYIFLRLDYIKKYFHFIVSMNLAEIFQLEHPEKGAFHSYIEFKEEFYKRSLVPIFNWAKEKGEMSPLFDDLAFCRIVDGMTIGVIHDWLRHKEVIGDIEETSNKLVDFLINGIGKS